MQLKAGCPVWLRNGAVQLGGGPVKDSIKCEVAVIGAGITGALVGERLAGAGVDVVVLDSRPAAQGSTSASTGLIQYELDTTLLELVEHRGESEASAAYRLCAQALAGFEEYLSVRGVVGGIERRDSLFLAAHGEEIKTFQEERRARRACGIQVQFLSAGELRERFGIARPGALWSPGALAIDPYQTGAGLLKRAMGLGLRLHTPTRVIGYQADDTGVTLSTDGGCQVRAGRVVFATGYETPVFLNVPVSLKTTYALSSQPGTGGAGWNPQCMIWESARPYLYARSGPGGRVIVGGADDPWSPAPVTEAQIGAKSGELVRKFQALLPEVPMSVEHAWSGVFAETKDGLPFIGGTERFPRGYFALGYGGNGILFSHIAAGMIAALFLGGVYEGAELFRFGR
jgi:glycine/D-amino acid oxidase-like deaminating enzyme